MSAIAAAPSIAKLLVAALRLVGVSIGFGAAQSVVSNLRARGVSVKSRRSSKRLGKKSLKPSGGGIASMARRCKFWSKKKKLPKGWMVKNVLKNAWLICRRKKKGKKK